MAEAQDEIQAMILKPGAQRTPYEWQMAMKAKPYLETSDEEGGKLLKGEAKRKYDAALEKARGEYASIKQGAIDLYQSAREELEADFKESRWTAGTVVCNECKTSTRARRTATGSSRSGSSSQPAYRCASRWLTCTYGSPVESASAFAALTPTSSAPARPGP